MGFWLECHLVYEFNENNRVGLVYHQKVDIDFEDDSAVSRVTYLIRGQGPAAGGVNITLTRLFRITGFHQVTDNLALHYSYKFTTLEPFQRVTRNL